MGIFDIFRRKPQAGATAGSSGAASAGGDVSFPWKDDRAFIACNLAYGDLVNNIDSVLTVDGRLHAESYIAAVGAVAGFAAQRALFAAMPHPTGLMSAQTKSGEAFYFGDVLNNALLPVSDEDGALKVWPLAAGAAVAAGNNPPPLEPMFAHVAAHFDGDFIPSVGYEPQAPVKALLMRAWPLARMCFDGQLSGKRMGEHGIVPQRWRPAVAAQALHVCLRRSQSVLDPLVGVTIAMESAIYASKLDPQGIEPQ